LEKKEKINQKKGKTEKLGKKRKSEKKDEKNERVKKKKKRNAFWITIVIHSALGVGEQ
jgi:hypothetical protein